MTDAMRHPPESIRNQFLAKEGLPPIKYKNIDADSTILNNSIIDFYAQQWDEFIALENQLQGALPDSLIMIIN